MGQGSDTAMAQIAAEVLDIRSRRRSAWSHPDTDVTPYDMGTLGSRSTFHMGHAVKLAAEDARDKLAALASETRPAAGQQPARSRNVSPKKYGMQAGNVHRHRQLHAELRVARSDNRPVARTRRRSG